MIVSNMEIIPGKHIKEHLGLVQGSTVRTKHFGRSSSAADPRQLLLDNCSSAIAPRQLLLGNCSCIALLPAIHGSMRCPDNLQVLKDKK